MPPPAPRHIFAKEKKRASELFVDREGPKALYREAVLDVAANPNTPRILTFYGPGGQGKTALCDELIRLSGKPPLKACKIDHARIDLHASRPRGYWHGLVSVRNAIAAATGASFPCFDLAFADWWTRAMPDQPQAVLGGRRLEGMADAANETLGSFASGGATLAVKAATDGVVGLIADTATDLAGGVPFLGPLLQRTSKWAVRKGYEELVVRRRAVLAPLYADNYSPDAIEIEDNLADILAHELALLKRGRKGRTLVLSIDEYENAMPSGGSLGGLISDPWDRALRDFISSCANGRYTPLRGKGDYDYEVGLLLVVFGREALVWDQIDKGWGSDLAKRQHRLDGLSRRDAEDYLIEAGVREPAVRDAIIEASTAADKQGEQEAAFPIMLDLSVQTYFDLRALGGVVASDDFASDAVTYADKRKALFERFIRNYRDVAGLKALLQRLACCREFDRETAWFLNRHFALGFDMSQFGSLVGLSFVSESADAQGWVMHRHIRETLADTLSRVDLQETHAALFDRAKEKATPAPGETISLTHAEALSAAMVHLAWAELPEGDLHRGLRSHIIANAAWAEIITAAAREALEVALRISGAEHLNTATALNNLGVILSDHPETDLEAQRMLYDSLGVRRRNLPQDDLLLAETLLNIANVVRFDEERFALLAEVIEILSANLPAAHEELLMARLSWAEALTNQEPEGAEELLLDIRRTVDETETTDSTLKMRISLGISAARTKRYDREGAVSWARTAVEDAGRTLALDHSLSLYAKGFLAHALAAWGDFEEADALHQSVVATAQHSFGVDHKATLDPLLGWAMNAQSAGWYAIALERARQAHETSLRVLGPDHIVTLQLESETAKALCGIGRFDEAVEIQTAVTDRLSRNDLDPEIRLSHISWLAHLQGEAGAIEAACALYRQTAAEAIALHPPRWEQAVGYHFARFHLEQLDDRSRLAATTLEEIEAILNSHRPKDRASSLMLLQQKASLMLRAGEDAEAVALARATLTAAQELLGDDHLSVANYETNLAETLAEVGSVQEADALARKAHDTIRNAWGDPSPPTAASLRVLAQVSRMSGDYQVEARLREQVWSICNHSHGDSHYATAGALAARASCSISLRQFSQAAPFLDSALSSATRRGREDSVFYQFVRAQRAYVDGCQGLRPSAAEDMRSCIARMKTNPETPTHWPGATRMYLADLLLRQDDPSALAEAALGVDDLKRHRPAGQQVEQARTVLARAMARFGDPSKGLVEAEDAEERLIALCGADHPFVGQASAARAQSLETLGRLEEAIAAYRLAATTGTIRLGADHPDLLDWTNRANRLAD